jgi:hypothetical protein
MNPVDHGNGYPSIGEKIRETFELYGKLEGALKEDAGIQNLSEVLREKIVASSSIMNELGIVNECRRCEEEDGGSCCGIGIENRYTPALLLANLLWGVTLPGERRLANSCYFLGATGCTLKVRDILCINYLCSKIEKMLASDDLIRLQYVVGEEMDTIFLLHESIKKIMRC